MSVTLFSLSEVILYVWSSIYYVVSTANVWKSLGTTTITGLTDTQWAAVRIQCWLMMLPPHVWYQLWRPRRCKLTCQGHTQRFASWPPTMRFCNSGDSNGTPHNCKSSSCRQQKYSVAVLYSVIIAESTVVTVDVINVEKEIKNVYKRW